MKHILHEASDEFADYLRESARPLASLLLIAPLLMVYETTAALHPDMTRSVTESWLHSILRLTGLRWVDGSPILLPLFVCVAIGCAHYVTRRPYRIPWRLTPAMFCEAVLGGILLVILLQSLASMYARFSMGGYVPPLTINPATATSLGSGWHSAFSYIGSGLYEELIFRAMMITPIAWCLKRLGETHRMSLVAAVTVSSLLFALAHYQTMNVTREQFQWFTFSFRMLAGLLFSALYIKRGLGITVGAHVAYDMIVALNSNG